MRKTLTKLEKKQIGRKHTTQQRTGFGSVKGLLEQNQNDHGLLSKEEVKLFVLNAASSKTRTRSAKIFCKSTSINMLLKAI